MTYRLIVPLVYAVMLRAQDAAPPVVFSVSTTIVQIDAVVSDRKGHQVTNLKADDFRVSVDGTLQAISNFSYVPLDSADVNRSSIRPEALNKPMASANSADVLKPEDVRRSVVLVVDDLSLSFESMYSVRRTLLKFVDEQMQPGDLVALWETGRTNSVFQQFTSDRRVLRAAIENLHWNPMGLGLVDPFAPDQPDLNRLTSLLTSGTTGPPSRGPVAPNGSDRQPQNDAEATAYNRLGATLGALDTLTQLMDELRPVGGRKAVVFLSDGIDLPGINVPGNPIPPDDRLIRLFHKLIDKANRAGAVVYTIDARGLAYVGPERLEALALSQDGLLQLAEDTGGFATLNSNALSDAIQRIEETQRGYYLIGFKAPENIRSAEGPSSDYHKIRVMVTGPGLHVASRSGFFGETDDVARPKYRTRQEQMLAAVQSLFNKSELHVRVTALYRRTLKGQNVVHNLLYVDPRDIDFRTDLYGSRYAYLDLVILATGNGYGPLAEISRHIAIDADEEKLTAILKAGLLFTPGYSGERRGTVSSAGLRNGQHVARDRIGRPVHQHP